MLDVSSIDIRVNKWGRIKTGDEAGWHVLVQDDSEASGGFLVLTKPEPTSLEGHDSWVEKYEDLPGFFAEAGWDIEWIE